MRKLIIGIVVLLALVFGLGVYLVTHLDGIAKRAIETAGSDALGTAVRVDSVAIDLAGGTATLSGFTVANPAGFSRQDMMRFDELRVAIDIASLREDTIRITSISSVNPYMLYEMQGARSNIDAVRERFPPSEAPADSTSAPLRLAIDEVRINGIQGALQADQLPRTVLVELGDISLPPAEGTPEEIARQLARPLLNQLASNASAAMTRALAGAVEDELRDRAGAAADEVRNRLEEELQQSDQRVQDAANQLRDRLGL